MVKRVSRQEKVDQAIKDIINKMFEIAGHDVTYDDIVGRTDNWYTNWTMTMDQAEQWKAWGAEHLRKSLRMSKRSAEREMLWANLQWGLKYEDYKDGK